MAGKEIRIDSILAHHETMMENHDKLLEALDDNLFVYPDAGNAVEIDETAKDETSPAPEAAAAESVADGEDQETLIEQIAEKLSAFESEGLSDLLDRLLNIPGQDDAFVSSIKQIRELAADFDFLGATEILERMGK